jgi:hypothetical protein
MSHEVYRLTDPIQVGMPAACKWAVGKRTATSVDFKEAFVLKRTARLHAALLDEAEADALDAKKAEHAKTFRHPNERRFHYGGDVLVSGTIQSPRKRLRLLLLDEALDLADALSPDHRRAPTLARMKALTPGDFMFVPNAGWLFCVNLPEPCGVCNGHGCAECDPNR